MLLSIIATTIKSASATSVYWFSVASTIIIILYAGYYIWHARKSFKPESEIAWLLSAGLIYAILTCTAIFLMIYGYKHWI